MYVRSGIYRPSSAAELVTNRTSVVLNYQGKNTLSTSYQLKTDSLHISDTGKQLHLSKKETNEDFRALWSNVITSTRADKNLRLLDKHISKAGLILEEMNLLAKDAQDKTLTDMERIEIQINIGRLQYRLDLATYALRNDLVEDFRDKNILMPQAPDYEDTEAYKMLARAKERIDKGESWDVAEIRTPIVKEDDLGMYIDRYEVEITDDANVPTVGDILKTEGLSVMDSNAATISVAEIDREIAGLRRQREKIVMFVGKNGESTTQLQNFWHFKLRSLANSTLSYFKSLSKQMYAIVPGKPKDENGNYIDIKEKLIDRGVFYFESTKNEVLQK
jgi:hypothetical protein